MTDRTEPHERRFNRTSFITLHRSRLFTATQVADIVEKHSSAGAEQCPHWIKIEHSDGGEWCCQNTRPPCEECAYQSKYAEIEQRIRDVIEELEQLEKITVPTKQIMTFDQVITLLKGVKEP